MFLGFSGHFQLLGLRLKNVEINYSKRLTEELGQFCTEEYLGGKTSERLMREACNSWK